MGWAKNLHLYVTTFVERDKTEEELHVNPHMDYSHPQGEAGQALCSAWLSWNFDDELDHILKDETMKRKRKYIAIVEWFAVHPISSIKGKVHFVCVNFDLYSSALD